MKYTGMSDPFALTANPSFHRTLRDKAAQRL
jgi:hypothetical protein